MSRLDSRPAILTLVLLSVSAAAIAAPPMLTNAELKARQYVADHTAMRAPYELNLAEDNQYQYVMAMLRLHGETPEKSPELFRELRAAHAKGNPGPPRLATGPAKSSATPAGGAAAGVTEVALNPVVPTNMISYLWNDQTNAVVDTALLSSIPGGTDSTTMMVNMTLAGQPQPFGVSPVYQQMAGGENFIEDWEAIVPGGTPANTTMVANSLFIASAAGTPTTFSMTVDGTTPASCQCVTAPNYGLNQQFPACNPAVGGNATTACSTSTTICINKGTLTPVVSCYGRNNSNCNYGWGGTGYPPYITLQVAGSLSFPTAVATSLQGSYLLNLQNAAGGGGCYLPSGGGSPAVISSTNFWIDPQNSSQLDYCFPASQFTNNSCLTGATPSAYINLNIWVLLANGSYGNATVSSQTDTWHQPWYAQVPIINIVQGCLAAGTKILMADGTLKNIETFKGDGSESIISSSKGDVMKVVGTTVGVETEPMYRITTSGGQSVMMTAMHTVPTPKGIVLAMRLRAGDKIFTRSGPVKITKIERVKYDGKVWNLNIGEERDAQTGRATMFANDILTGDAMMQQNATTELYRKGRTKEEILARLPQQWHQDYLNHQKP
ncbi:MAG: Hint domain-containing protein, partial [Vicinamibacterales bacterium]